MFMQGTALLPGVLPKRVVHAPCNAQLTEQAVAEPGLTARDAEQRRRAAGAAQATAVQAAQSAQLASRLDSAEPPVQTGRARDAVQGGMQALAGLFGAAGDVATRLRRGFEPHPAGFPAGAPTRRLHYLVWPRHLRPQHCTWCATAYAGPSLQPPTLFTGPRGEVVFELLRDPLAFLEATAARHGGAAALVLGGERVVLVSDPGLAQAVLVDQVADFVKARRAPALRAQPLRPACGPPARVRAWAFPTLRWGGGPLSSHYVCFEPKHVCLCSCAWVPRSRAGAGRQPRQADGAQQDRRACPRATGGPG